MSTATTDPRSTAALPETITVAGEERHVLRGATWRFYDWLTDALGERAPFRVAYDGRDIEIMTPGPNHGRFRELLSVFVNEVEDGLEIDCWELGSTTWKRPELGRGIESDLCYCFEPAKIEACEAADSRDSDDVADYPNPDLAVEVDLSPPKIDPTAIYRALQVAEIWRLRAGIVSIEQSGVDGNYVAAESSRFLHVTPEEVTRWVVNEKSGNHRQWKSRLRKWILTELKPRVDS